MNNNISNSGIPANIQGFLVNGSNKKRANSMPDALTKRAKLTEASPIDGSRVTVQTPAVPPAIVNVQMPPVPETETLVPKTPDSLSDEDSMFVPITPLGSQDFIPLTQEELP